MAILSEFTYRWGKLHACTPHALWLRENFPPFPFETNKRTISSPSGKEGSNTSIVDSMNTDTDVVSENNQSSGKLSSRKVSQTETPECPEIVFESKEDPRLYPLEIPEDARMQSQSHFVIPYPSLKEPTYYCTEGIPKGCTPFPLAMPKERKQPNAVEAYRMFYQTEKRELLQYTKREMPPWIDLSRVPQDLDSETESVLSSEYIP